MNSDIVVRRRAARAAAVWLAALLPAAAAAQAPLASPAPAEGDAALTQQLGELLKELRALRGEMSQLRQAIATMRAAAPGPPAPPPAPARVSLDDAAALGSADAPVAIVEFSEYQCPFCKRFHEQTLPRIKERYIDTGKVRYVFRDFPLGSIHPQARAAAVAANCAGKQGSYWQMHDLLFTNQARLGPPLYDELARTLKLDVEKYQACREAADSAKEVDDDLAYGGSIGVQGTPHFFIGRLKDGHLVDVRRLSGAQPLPAFTKVIDELLAPARAED
ncbi:MAG TPA: thioredoxin domain-containing protein [Vicinamibacteria bacterium]|nr:thioredoxin domain-containing protein [Vicinamibacteria bacterium]